MPGGGRDSTRGARPSAGARQGLDLHQERTRVFRITLAGLGDKAVNSVILPLERAARVTVAGN